MDIIKKAGVIHDYSNFSRVSEGSGPLTIDGDFETYWQTTAVENRSFSQCNGGRTTGHMYSQHTFPRPYTINGFVAKFWYSISVSGGASKNEGGYTFNIQTLKSGIWTIVPGTNYDHQGGSTTGFINISLEDLEMEDIEGVRAFADGHGDKQCCSACGGSTTAYARIYEIQAFGKALGSYAAVI
jgi:hypothetical protein